MRSTLKRKQLNKGLKEMREWATWLSRLWMFQIEDTASAQTLRWGVPGRFWGAEDWSQVNERNWEGEVSELGGARWCKALLSLLLWLKWWAVVQFWVEEITRIALWFQRAREEQRDLLRAITIILVKGDGDSGQIGGRQDSGKWSDSGYLF